MILSNLWWLKLTIHLNYRPVEFQKF